MTRTTIGATALTANGLANATSVAIDIANGMTITAAEPEKTILLVTNTDAAAHVVTLRAGDPVTGDGSQIDQSFTIPASGSRYVGPFDSTRCTQKDRSMALDFVTGHTGTVTALTLPRGF